MPTFPECVPRAVTDCSCACLAQTEKNSHTVYDLLLTVVPSTEGTSYPAEALSALLNAGTYGVRVKRNYGHFEWLDASLRSDAGIASKLTMGGIQLPREHRPRRFGDPSSWFSARPNASDRGVGLVAYLRQLLALFCGPTAEPSELAVLVKAFFSPYALFRPLRAAFKHNMTFKDATAIVRVTLSELTGSRDKGSDGESRLLYDATCGLRLEAEHVLLPDMQVWLQLATDRAVLPEVTVLITTNESLATRARAEQDERAAAAEKVRLCNACDTHEGGGGCCVCS